MGMKEPNWLHNIRRRIRWVVQRQKYEGFDDRDTWNLDQTLSAFILPRLKLFVEINGGHCHPPQITFDKWLEILNDMVFAFEWNLSEESDRIGDTQEERIKTEKNWKRYKRGMKYFAQYFRSLWS
jgi:hypothetical protein